jgi:hypothetical protein
MRVSAMELTLVDRTRGGLVRLRCVRSGAATKPSPARTGGTHDRRTAAVYSLIDLQPEIWTVQNGNFLVISPAGRRENSHEGVEIFGTADCADLEAG